MAEATERTAIVRDPATPPVVGPLPGLPAAQGAEPYRPLSLLALGGFLLAVLYASLITIGGLSVFAYRHPTPFKVLLVLVPLGAILWAAMRGVRELSRLAAYVGTALAVTAAVIGLASLVAYSGSNPWVLPNGIWALLIAAALISLLARARIQASENTLSGAGLAYWGMMLSLFFGLVYFAYLTSSLLAVRRQASDCAEDFLAQLKKGDLLQAFIRTLPPSSRPTGDLRRTVEVKYNVPPPGSRDTGAFSSFCRNDLVRIFLLAGEAVKLEPGSLTDDFDNGAHKVTLRYRVTTAEGSFEAAVSVLGREDSESGLRQWQIIHAGTYAVLQDGSAHFTGKGEAVMMTQKAAYEFAQAWTMKLRYGKLDEAYLATIPGAQRDKERLVLPSFSPALFSAAGLASWTLRPAGRDSFGNGSLIDNKDLWAMDPKLRNEMSEAVHEAFAGTLPVPVEFELPVVRVPLCKESGNLAAITLACRMIFMEPTGKPRFAIEGEIVVELPLSSTASPVDDIRIRSLRLVRGHIVYPPKQIDPPPG